MHLTYEKLGKDHPKYGQVEYIVMDGMKPVCYKTNDGYQPLETSVRTSSDESSQPAVKTQSLFVLSFKMNDEAEEMTFKSKKKMDKTIELFKTKESISGIETKEYQIVV